MAETGDRDEDQDLANDFMRLNFDRPDNLPVIRENAERFCQQVPDRMRIVLVSVSTGRGEAIDDVSSVPAVGRHDCSPGTEYGSICRQLLCGDAGIGLC